MTVFKNVLRRPTLISNSHAVSVETKSLKELMKKNIISMTKFLTLQVLNLMTMRIWYSSMIKKIPLKYTQNLKTFMKRNPNPMM